MSGWFLAVIGLLYAGATATAAMEGDWRSAGLFLCYALSNVFLVAMQQAVRT